MPKKLIVFPQNLGSESAKLIAEEFKATRVKPDGKYVPDKNHVILNWGNSEAPLWAANVGKTKVLNHWDKLKNSINKHSAFKVMKAAGVAIPLFTTNAQDARDWINNGDWAVGRQILNGSQGDGIVMCKTLDEVNKAKDIKMWTKYFKRSSEFRVFVAGGKVFDVAQKKAKKDLPQGKKPNFEVRNLEGGWIYARQDIEVPDIVKQVAVDATKALGLDIAAVDIGYNKTANTAVCFELNSAFGLAETTLESVVEVLGHFLAGEDPVPDPIPIHQNVKLNIPGDEEPKKVAQAPQVFHVKPAPVPAAAVAVPKPKVNKKHDVSFLTDLEIVEEDGCVRVYGLLGKKKVLAVEAKGNVTRSLAEYLA